MPPNSPIRANFQSGTLASSLNSTATAVTFAAAPVWPTLGANQYAAIELIDSSNLANSEVMYVTAYTAGNTTAGVDRAQESTGSLGGGSARTWGAGATWEHGPTQRDFQPNLTIGGNTSGTAQTIGTGPVMIAGGSNVTVQQSGNTLSIHANEPAASFWPNAARSTVLTNVAQNFTTATNGTTFQMTAFPMQVPADLVYNDVLLPVLQSATNSVTNANASYTQFVGLALMKPNASTQTMSQVEFWTNRQAVSLASTGTSGSGSATYGMTAGPMVGTAGSSTWSFSTASATATAYWSQFTGSKLMPFRSGYNATTLTAGNYVGLLMASSSSAGSNVHAFAASVAIDAAATNQTLQPLGITTGSSRAQFPYQGLATGSIGTFLSNVNLTASNITTVTNQATSINRSIVPLFRASLT